MPLTDPAKRRLPPGSPCTNCGKCCTNPHFMGSLTATNEDVDRWEDEGRDDILRYVSVLGEGGYHLPMGGYADLWIDENGNEKERCPFVRKVRGQNRYLCTIYETRPQTCRDYVPWSGKENDVCEVV